MQGYPQNASLQNQAVAISQNLDSHTKDVRPKLGELISAAHQALDNLDGGVSNLEVVASPVMDGEPVNQTGATGMPSTSNPSHVDDLMRVVMRIQGIRFRIDSMAQRLRV